MQPWYETLFLAREGHRQMESAAAGRYWRQDCELIQNSSWTETSTEDGLIIAFWSPSAEQVRPHLVSYYFRWAKGSSAKCHSVYGDKCFTRPVNPVIHVWCKKFAHGHESVVDEEGPGRQVAVLFRRPMQRSQQSIVSCRLTGVWWAKCLNEFRRYVEKWNVKVWRLNTFAFWTCSLSS